MTLSFCCSLLILMTALNATITPMAPRISTSMRGVRHRKSGYKVTFVAKSPGGKLKKYSRELTSAKEAKLVQITIFGVATFQYDHADNGFKVIATDTIKKLIHDYEAKTLKAEEYNYDASTARALSAGCKSTTSTSAVDPGDGSTYICEMAAVNYILYNAWLAHKVITVNKQKVELQPTTSLGAHMELMDEYYYDAEVEEAREELAWKRLNRERVRASLPR
eukprot:818003_1